jgi:hypothetical protein
MHTLSLPYARNTDLTANGYMLFMSPTPEDAYAALRL